MTWTIIILGALGLCAGAFFAAKDPKFWFRMLYYAGAWLWSKLNFRKLTPEEKAKALARDDGFKGQSQTKPIVTGKVITKTNTERRGKD